MFNDRFVVMTTCLVAISIQVPVLLEPPLDSSFWFNSVTQLHLHFIHQTEPGLHKVYPQSENGPNDDDTSNDSPRSHLLYSRDGLFTARPRQCQGRTSKRQCRLEWG
jgi:hypothetical protein